MEALDEARITTSEGQSYAMLRAVWANDPWTFERIWAWTGENLQVRGDHLFAWKEFGRCRHIEWDHSLYCELRDDHDAVLARSQVVAVHVRRHGEHDDD